MAGGRANNKTCLTKSACGAEAEEAPAMLLDEDFGICARGNDILGALRPDGSPHIGAQPRFVRHAAQDGHVALRPGLMLGPRAGGQPRDISSDRVSPRAARSEGSRGSPCRNRRPELGFARHFASLALFARKVGSRASLADRRGVLKHREKRRHGHQFSSDSELWAPISARTPKRASLGSRSGDAPLTSDVPKRVPPQTLPKADVPHRVRRGARRLWPLL